MQLVRSTKEVVDAVQDAVWQQLRVAVRSGGHCLEAFVADPAVRVVIDTSLMTGVHHDPAMGALDVFRHALSVRPASTATRTARPGDAELP